MPIVNGKFPKKFVPKIVSIDLTSIIYYKPQVCIGASIVDFEVFGNKITEDAKINYEYANAYLPAEKIVQRSGGVARNHGTSNSLFNFLILNSKIY